MSGVDNSVIVISPGSGDNSVLVLTLSPVLWGVGNSVLSSGDSVIVTSLSLGVDNSVLALVVYVDSVLLVVGNSVLVVTVVLVVVVASLL